MVGRKRTRYTVNLNFTPGLQVLLCVFIFFSGFYISSLLQFGKRYETQVIIEGKQYIRKFVPVNDKPSPRILCWVMTSPKFLYDRALHVKRTWGSRCDKTLFFSSVTDITFPVIGLNVSEGREHLTEKSHHAFRYLYKHYIDDFDWFLKADDNTYIIVENLKRFLASKDPETPAYYGQHFSSVIEGGYASGGAGYVLSKEAVRRLTKHGSDSLLCRQDGGSEDVEIGKCLHNLGAYIGDSFDEEGRTLFHCFNIVDHIFGRFPTWYHDYSAGRSRAKGISSMSNKAVSFHYVKPDFMYVYDFLLYHLDLTDQPLS